MKKKLKQQKIGFIYQIKNLANGKRYIGSTGNLKNREYNHFDKLRKNKHASKEMQFDFNQYGEDNFIMEMISKHKIKNKNALIMIEMYYILKHNPEYNKNMPGFEPVEYTQKDINNVYLTLNL